MEEYKSNSHKSREEKKKVEAVVKGSAKTKKKNEIRKLADIFIAEDVQDIKSYILFDVLVPTIKKAIIDSVDMIFNGGSGRSKKSSSSRVSYVRYYDKTNDRERSSSRSSRVGYDYDDIIFENRGDAETVLDGMNDIINQYGVISVADLYELADIKNNNYATNKYGWTDIRGSRAVRTRSGEYVLKLPRALPLD